MQVSAQIELIQSSVKVAGLSRGEVSIGHASLIGDSVILLPGSSVGVGAVIGAGSVVTRAIPDFAIAAGNPARILRMRFEPHVIKYLSEVSWWNWPLDKIRRNRDFFEVDFSLLSPDELLDVAILD